MDERRHRRERQRRGDSPRLTDEEIREIARDIRRAIWERPDAPGYEILSAHHELPPEDEARVEAALAELRRGGRRARRAG